MVDKVRKSWEGIDKIVPGSAPEKRLSALIKKLTDKQLKDFEDAKIKFVSQAASAELIKRKYKKEEFEESFGGNPQAVAKKIAQMTDDNDHTGAAIELAKYVGDGDTLGVLQFIQKRSNKQGHTGEGDLVTRNKLVKKLLSKIKDKSEQKLFHKAF